MISDKEEGGVRQFQIFSDKWGGGLGQFLIFGLHGGDGGSGPPILDDIIRGQLLTLFTIGNICCGI